MAMNEYDIRDARFNNTLKDVVSEAISTLNDATVSSLTVVDVKVARGKADATIFLDKEELSKEEQERAVSRLGKASGYISKYILASLGKFRAPKLTFKFDDTTEALSKLDELFKKIEDERNSKNKD